MFDSIVEAVFYHSQNTPDKFALADDNVAVSYREYAEMIGKYARVFKDMGIESGDRVVVEASQTVQYLALELALQLISAVFVPVEHNCAVEKIKSFTESSGAKVVITVKPGEYPTDKAFTYVELTELYNNVEAFTAEKMPEACAMSEILFSTGTTGKEKGIMLSHANDIALSENVIYGVEMENDNVEMIPSPMNHSHGLRRYYANMYKGASVVLLGSIMNMKKFFSNIEEYGVNSMDLVPSALSVLLKLSKDRLAQYADTLRYIQFGAAPMMKADQDKICSLLPKTRLYNFYGSTESGCICIHDFNRNKKERCIGKPAHNARIFIVDDERREIVSSKERTGLLASFGGMNMLGYWNDAEETEKVLADGVVYSNDEAYFDEDGEIILLGRKGDVINVAGNKVSPEEIENLVKTFPEIADCGVVPVPDAIKGHVPKLFVELKVGHTLDATSVHTRIAEKLEPYKIPAYIEQISKIPRSYNGKLLRKELK